MPESGPGGLKENPPQLEKLPYMGEAAGGLRCCGRGRLPIGRRVPLCPTGARVQRARRIENPPQLEKLPYMGEAAAADGGLGRQACFEHARETGEVAADLDIGPCSAEHMAYGFDGIIGKLE